VGPLWFVLFVLLVPFSVSLARANEMFVISVRQGRVLLVRGRILPGLYDDIADVVERAAVQRATLRVVRSGGAPQLLVSGVDELVTQRLRNVVGLYPDQKQKNAPSPKRRNLGQQLGIAWLAWWLEPRR
jgi:hypothetical protein